MSGNSGNEEVPLPEGWEKGVNQSGRTYFIDHINEKTTWIDPRDRYVRDKYLECRILRRIYSFYIRYITIIQAILYSITITLLN